MTSILRTISPILSGTLARWQQIEAGFPAEVLERTPAPDEWSARDCLHHLVDVEQAFQSRLKSFQAEKDFEAFDPVSSLAAADRKPSTTELLEKYEMLRNRTLEELASVSEEHLSNRVNHAELGPVTLEEMLNEWVAHDLSHTVQAEEALMQEYIENCGPWRVFFTAHLPSSST